MNNEQKNIEKIDRYLNGELSPEEQLAFDNELLKNEELEEEVELLKAARATAYHAGRSSLKKKLNQFEEEIKTPVRRIVPFRWLAAAAAVLILLVAGIWFSKNGRSDAAHEKLFADHFETYRNPILIRGGEKNSDEYWPSAVNAYAKGDFQTAAELFRQSLNDTLTIGYLAHFYRGVSLLSQPQPDAELAVSALDSVIVLDNDYRLQAMWYKGLSLLYLNKKEEAKHIFSILEKEGGYKEKELDDILQKL